MSDEAGNIGWQRYRKAIWILVVLLLCAGGIIFVVYAYAHKLSWTGFNESQGPNVLQYQSTKTLWDWLQLLFIPVVLSVTAYWFNRVNSQREQKLTEQRDKTERAIALDNQRADLLQDYLDRMSDLLIGHKFHDTQTGQEARNIARARTLIVLPHLDDKRKGRLIQFLYESQLLKPGKDNCVSLDKADLSEADLSYFDLNGINLNDANLSHARLSGTNLSKANLRGACLYKADLHAAILRSADLCDTNLSEATLNGAHMQDAKLIQANLSGAWLIRADATGANFSDAMLNDAVFEHTNISDATISKAQLSKVQGLS